MSRTSENLWRVYSAAILHNLEEDLDKVEVPEKNDAGVTKPGQ